MKKIRLGIFGCRRGRSYIKAIFNGNIPDVRVTAICEKDAERIGKALELCPKGRWAPKVFTDAEEFFASGTFDAVLLCNYFTEHAKYAILALQNGIHVFSETMAAVTMADAVALVRAAEGSPAVYMLGENYPYLRSLFEMRRIYAEGSLGRVAFAEGEYVHPMGPVDTDKYTNPEKNGYYNWRRFLPPTYYSSHALAPLMYLTGEMPRRVVGMSSHFSDENIRRFGRNRIDSVGVMLVSTDKNSVFRVNGSSHMGAKGNWYRLGCENGGIETVRGNQNSVRLSYNTWDLPSPDTPAEQVYEPAWPSDGERADACGHSGGDYWVLRFFFDAIRGRRAPFPDVYAACALSATAILGWRSILGGNIPFDIPDFRDEEQRNLWEDDRLNPFPTENEPNTLPFTSLPVTAD